MNHGVSTCALTTSHFDPTFLDEAGRPLPVAQGHPKPDDMPENPHPSAWAFALEPGQAAALRLSWDNWCPAAPPMARPTLPSGEPLTSPLLAGETPTGSVPQCNDASAPSSLVDYPLALALSSGDDGPIGPYFAATNRSDYRAAYDLLSPGLQEQQPFDAFVAGLGDIARHNRPS